MVKKKILKQIERVKKSWNDIIGCGRFDCIDKKNCPIEKECKQLCKLIREIENKLNLKKA